MHTRTGFVSKRPLRCVLTLLFAASALLCLAHNAGAKPPYPIVLVHGLISSDEMWGDSETGLLNHFKSLGWSKGGVIHFKLGQEDTLSEVQMLDPKNVDNSGDIWLINFKSSSVAGSNAAPIYLQARALQLAIAEIRKRTHSSKVVLIGHSMGGLAAAAYLSGQPNPSIALNPPYGYQNDVAKLLTLGTPFAGSGYANWLNLVINSLSPPLLPLDTANALRDLSTSESLLHQNVFLFGGLESEVSSNFISKDVNCDGDNDDRLDGIHSLPETTWPQSVSYFWIVGDLDGRDGDCIVSPESQNRPFGERKTIDAAHTHAFLLCEFSCTEAESFDAIIEGLDEPDDIARAWLLPWGSFDGFITHQGDGRTSSDQDYFKFRINGPERIAFTFQNALVGDVEVEIRDVTAPNAVYSEVFPVNGSSQTELLLTATSYPRDFHLIIRGVAPASGSGLDGDSATRACDSELEFLRRPYNFTLSPLSPSKVTLSASPTIVPPGGLATLRAQVQEANGTPLGSGIEVSFSPVRPGLVGCTVRGSVCVKETDATGVAEVRFSTATLGTYGFSATAITGGSATASVQVKLGGISASASPNPVTINLPSTLNVTVTNGAGQPVASQAVTFKTTHPGLFSGNGFTSSTSPSSVLTDSNGQTWIRFTPTATGTASLTIETANASAVLLSLQAVPPAGGLNLSLSAGFLSGDAGSSTYEIEALVTDAQGNPVLGEPVQFSTTRGSLSDPSSQTGSTGVTDTNLTVNTSGDVTVTATARDTSAATTFFAQIGSGGGNQMVPHRSFAFTDDVYGLSFTPDGSTLLVADYNGHLKAWNTADWSLRWETDATSDRTVQISLPPGDSTKFLVMHGDGADIRRVSDGGLICRIVNAESKGILGAWTSTSSFLGTSRGKLYRHGTQCSSGVDAYKLSVDEGIEDQAHGDYHVQKDMFAACVDSGAMIVWNKNGTFLRRLTVSVGANAYDTDFSADGSKLAAVGYRSVKIFDTSSWSATSYAAQALPDFKYGVTFLDNDSKLAVGSEGKIEIVSVAGGASFKVGDVNGRAFELAWNPQTGDLAVGTSAGMVQIFKPLAPVDTLPPTLSISEPLDGFTTNQAQLVTRGRVTDASGVASFRINGAPVGLDASGNFSHTVTLSPGANTINYSATDLLGQEATAQRSGMYLVDTAPPVISGVTVTPSSGSPGTAFEIRCTVVDGDSGVASVTATVRNSSGTVVATRALTAGSNNSYFTSMDSTGLVEGTYWVDLEAVDSSPAANVRTLAGAVTFNLEVALEPPVAPTWLQATAVSSTAIDLLWDDNANNEDGFKVERKIGPAGPWTLIATLPANTTTYQDSGLTCGMAHAYRAWAFNAAGDSATTNEAAATPECACAEALSPESLSFEALGGTGSFGVTACGPWTAESDESWIAITSGANGSGNGTVGFRVERSNVQSPRTGTIRLPELGLTFTVSQAAAPGDPGFSSFLRLVSGTVAGQAVGPDQRTVTVAPGASLSGSLSLRIDSGFPSNFVMVLGITPSWGDHATSYRDLGHFSTPASGLIRNVNLDFTAPSTPGMYHVIAAYRGEFNAGQVMSSTNWVVGTLVWNNGDDVASWPVETIETVNRDGNALVDYFYGHNIPTWMPATAITVVVESPTLQPPAAPTWLRATPASESIIDLLWDDNANNEDGFKVERKIGPAGPWTLIATLPANTTAYQDSGLTCDTAHAYRVWAFNAAGDSGTTNEAAATPECTCAEALFPESMSFEALGGTGSFGVTACGPWTAESDEGWIAITSGASGSGNGTVGFRVERNNVQSPRTGTIRLPELGLTFTVSQAAAPGDPGFSSFLRLVSGTVAGQEVGPDQRTVTVAPGASLAGNLSLRIDSSFSSNAVMALGITPSWGDHATSYRDLGSFSTPASGLIRNVNLNFTAPSTPGTYHVIAAYRGEFNAGQVMSATNWGAGTLVWNNGDDVADWSLETIETVNRDGNALVDYFYGHNIPTWMPAAAITVVVESPTLQPPAAPTWLRATPASESIIDLLWDDNSNNEDGFKVERKIGPAGPWTLIATLPANTTTYQDSGLTCGTAHAYRVWAFNVAGDSGTTNEAAATPECESIFLSEDFEDGASADWQTWTSGWSESGGMFHGTNTGANLRNEAVWSGGYDWSDYMAEVDLVLLDAYEPADGQLLVRYNSETDRISCRLFQYGSSRELQLLVPGRPTLAVPFSYATGQVYRLRASAVGDSVTCEVVGHPATRLVQSSLGSGTGTVGLRNTHIPVAFDNLTVLREADRTFSDSFESGDSSGWTSGTGGITVRPGLAGAGGQAQYLGNHGLEVALDGGAAFVQKDLPRPEASYRTRFAVNLNGLSLSEGDGITLFGGYGASGDASFRIAVRRSAGSDRLTAYAREDAGSEIEVPSTAPLAAGWRIVEIHWRRSTGPEEDEGALDLWVDGTPVSGLAGLDNDLQELDFVRWGSLDPAPGISGSFKLDELEARRVGPVGPIHLFTDVPAVSPFWPAVQGLYAAEITRGCAVRRYCPSGNVTRAEMAIFLVRAMHGPEVVLPAPAGIFSDVPVTHWAAAWIEQLRTDGITQGCATQPLRFCPGATVTRAEMAIFLLRARHGAGYVPPPATGTVFSDVPSSHWAAAWIEQLAAEGITSGCGAGAYCPGDPVTRLQMAVFLVRTFSLPTQQPAP